ncbi:MAG TPA: choice-of-anchor tandem repeat GloVer-containing protein [Steroidobacteraceae bacterium]
MPAFRSALALCALSLCALTAHAQTTTPAISTVAAFYPSKPSGNLVLGPDGALYGVASYLSSVSSGVVYRSTIDGKSIKTLYQIRTSDGIGPAAGLTVGSDDLLYGVTQYGSSTEPAGAGTVFSVSLTGTNFTILHRFDPQSTSTTGVVTNTEGAFPDSELLEGSDQYLYGVARGGGTAGNGTVFKLARDGTGFQVLHTFSATTLDDVTKLAENEDGAFPVGQLAQGADGFLYGVASAGGANGRGTVFKVAADGSSFQVLHTFAATTLDTTTGLQVNVDGGTPLAGVTDGADGYVYGVTSLGGGKGYGTVFAVPADGSTFSVLYAFEGTTGASPVAELTLGADGKLYGTTVAGGLTSSNTASSLGTIFSIDRAGTNFTTLHTFDGTVGYSPNSKLVEIATGDLIGTVNNGGRCGSSYGAIYRWSAAGTKYSGNVTCGVSNNNNGGGAAGPALLVLLGGLAWLRRRVR